jgi:hypothetical protein
MYYLPVCNYCLLEYLERNILSRIWGCAWLADLVNTYIICYTSQTTIQHAMSSPSSSTSILKRLHQFTYQLLRYIASGWSQKRTPFHNNSSSVIKVFTSPLHRNGSFSIVLCVFISAGISLPSHCLAMDVYYKPAIPALRRYVTILKFRPTVLQFCLVIFSWVWNLGCHTDCGCLKHSVERRVFGRKTRWGGDKQEELGIEQEYYLCSSPNSLWSFKQDWSVCRVE